MSSQGWFGKFLSLGHLLGIGYYFQFWVFTTGLAGTVAGLITLGSNQTIAIILIIIFLPILTGGVWFWWSTRRSLYRSANPQLRIIEIRTTYVVCGNGEYKFKQHLKARCLQEGVARYQRWFDWTGIGKIEGALEGDDLETIITDNSTRTGKTAEVVFDHAKRKGEEFEFSYTVTFVKTLLEPRNFFSVSTPRVVARKHTVTVQFAETEVPVSYQKITYATVEAVIPVKPPVTELMKMGQTKIFLEMNKPRLGYNYVVKWQGNRTREPSR